MEPNPEPAQVPEPQPAQTPEPDAELEPTHATSGPMRTRAQELDGLNLPCQDLFADNSRTEFFRLCVPLYEASIKGDWNLAQRIFQTHDQERRPLVQCSITDNCETMLHIAASAQSTNFVQNLVGKMQMEDLRYQNNNGNTALCFAAITGNVEIAKIMVEKNGDLLTIPNKQHMIPLYIAALYGKRDMVNYLYDKMEGREWTDKSKKWVYEKCVEADLYDIALQIFQNHPNIVKGVTQTVLGVLARKPSAFNETKQYLMRRLVNSMIRCFKGEPLENTSEAMKLLTAILRSIEGWSKNEIYELIRGPKIVTLEDQREIQTYPYRVLFVAAEMGNTKFIVELIRKYPDLIWKVNDNAISIFHIAVSHRHQSIYNLLYEIGSMKELIVVQRDRNDNNILHLVGKMTDKNRLQDVSGAAFQMQREMLWYKEVESMIPPSYRERKNKDRLTPLELFTRNHKELVLEGEKWMRGTASKCLVVATLIATVVFGVAYTIPGGYDGKNGFPEFRHNGPFLVFVVLDAISLILSSTSILVFLSILTSRYAQEDFIESLPKKLMVGLSMLFLSIVTMMIAFSASFFVLYRHKFITIAILITTLALMLIISYARLQYPLFTDVLRSTYGSRYLFQPKKRMLYGQAPRF